MDKKIRVVVADDSALMRKKISDILGNDPDIEVVGIVRNGEEVIEAIYALRPDVVTLDVEMPILNGLDALGYIMSEFPTPCVMISAFTKAGAKETIKALEFGAVDFITKPSGVISPDIDKLANEIIAKVKMAAGIEKENLKLIWAEKAVEETVIQKKPAAMAQVFAVASSTGGTQALATILPMLRGDFPASVLVVQHMPEGFTKSLAERLNWQSKINVVEAEDGMPIKPAQVILAKGGLHMEVAGTKDAPRIKLSDAPPQMGVRPCADVMMASAARIFGDKTVGVVLTGMGSDGTKGCRSIKEHGGYVIAEDKTSCIIYGMPKSVVDAGLADKISPLSSIVDSMEQLVKKI